MAGSVGRCDGTEHFAYFTMPCPRPDLLHRKGGLQQAFTLQRHGDKPLTSPWASPKSEALFNGVADERDKEESILDFVYIGLVSE